MSDVERDATTAKFLRGLTIGAIIGAIVAGSAFLTRQGGRQASAATPPEPAGSPRAGGRRPR